MAKALSLTLTPHNGGDFICAKVAVGVCVIFGNTFPFISKSIVL